MATINVTNVVREFRQADAQAYLDTYPFSQYLYESVFPELYRRDLSFKSIEASTGANIAADVSAFNSRASRKGREMPGVYLGEMPKISIARDKTEQDMITYRGLQEASRDVVVSGSSVQINNQIIDWLYGDQAFVVNGVRARLEWLAKRIVSTGKVSLTQTDNDGGVTTKYDVDFGIPASQKVTASKPWSDPTADPVADMRARKAAAKAKGKVLLYQWMNQTTFDILADNPNFQKFCATYVSNALGLRQVPDVATANAALKRHGLPEIVIWESFIAFEDKAGEKTIDEGWENGRVAFTTSRQLGNTQYTMTADEFMSVGTAVKTKHGIVLVKTWGVEDPPSVSTLGVAYAFPVLNNAKDIHILKTVA